MAKSNLKEKKLAKFFLNIILILGSAVYAGTQYFVTPSAPAAVPKVPVLTPPKKIIQKNRQYMDGVYTGNYADAYYGLVQVQATVSGGALTDVQFLSYPSDRSTSRYINGQAMPFLKTEAIQAQSGKVDIVSGATDTSLAFRESLTNALAQAK